MCPGVLNAFATVGGGAKVLAGTVLPGRWHVYPELAAAGLWTTPTDLVHFAIELGRAAFGRSRTVLTQRRAREMLTPRVGGFGLGVALNKTGAAGFFHNGRNAGFRCALSAVLPTGDGAVIMTNSDAGDSLYGEIIQAIVAAYAWPPITF